MAIAWNKKANPHGSCNADKDASIHTSLEENTLTKSRRYLPTHCNYFAIGIRIHRFSNDSLVGRIPKNVSSHGTRPRLGAILRMTNDDKSLPSSISSSPSSLSDGCLSKTDPLASFHFQELGGNGTVPRNSYIGRSFWLSMVGICAP